ncbi:MAG: hypothetical protein JRG67_05830 [Deltaproteobacteria bacterium]|nr:hypothetical protein [Deltaproteobacteria bacterium]MBW2213974.1 hypothetical protein [Deltaproteobacteria bacterium]MBW2549941.1 hypothetical protein [Deltaproteobacteria bacterium]MBW2626701.1 hypothetical protein [Deltaproteobacteria bacterium]
MSPSKSSKILFCPFCRDGFEGRTECPEHELTLVPIDKLPRKAEATLQSVTLFVDPRLGRGAVLFGAALPLIYTTRRIGLVAESYTSNVEWLWGLWLMAAGLVVAAFGSRRLGATRRDDD